MMQQAYSAHRQAHLADQAARQTQLQVRLGHHQARRSGSRMASAAGQGSTRPAQVPARRRTGKLAGWGVAVSVVFWAIAIATQVERVMQHDGPVTPVSHSLAVVVSVLVAGLPLTLSGPSRHRTQGNAADWDRAGALEHDEEEEGDHDR